MLQFNLLPDLKQEYIKAERTRRLVLSVSLLVAAVSIGILLLLFSWETAQKKHISDLGKDIKNKAEQLAGKQDINKILTVQNQLNSLTDMHKAKPAVSRLPDYLNKVTPATVVDISDIKIDFAAKTVAITGSADSLGSVNKYIDTLKFTMYNADQANVISHAFSGVVLTAFGVGTGGGGTGKTNPHPATYTISFIYDPTIFDITKKIELIVPKIITTRSQVGEQGDLFKAAPKSSTTQGASNGQ